MKRTIFTMAFVLSLVLFPVAAQALTQQEIDAKTQELRQALDAYNRQNPVMIDYVVPETVQKLIDQGFLQGKSEDWKGFQGKNMTGDGKIDYTGKVETAPQTPGFTKSGSDMSSMSLVGAAAAPEAAQKKAADFKTDADTNDLQTAIDRFNRQFCPPNQPITEISMDTLLVLVRNELINRTDLRRFEDLLMRDGRVVRKVDVPSPPDPEEPQDPDPNIQRRPKTNMGDILRLSSQVLNRADRDAPTGPGMKKPDAPVRLRERRLSYRNQAGELVDVRYQVPDQPGVPGHQIVGQTFETTLDLMRLKLLPPKYRVNPKLLRLQPLPPLSTASTTKPIDSQSIDGRSPMEQ